MNDDLERMVTKIVGDHLGIPGAALSLRTHITDELGADSLDRVELITTVEEYFDIEIPSELISKIERIEDLVDSVRSLAADTKHETTIQRKPKELQ